MSILARNAMRLARKLILAVVIGIVLVVIVRDYFAVREDIRETEARVQDDIATLGYGLSITLAQVVRDSGPEAAESLIARRNEGDRIKIRWVALDVPKADKRAIELPPEAIAELRQGRLARLVQGSGPSARLFVYRPFYGQNPVHDIAEASESLAPLHERARRQITGMVVESIVILLLATGATFALGFRFVARPVQELVAQARRIGGGDLTQRLRLTGHAELSELAEELNLMADRLAAAQDRRLALQRQVEAETAAKLAALDQLRHADRLATIGQLASGVAHELGTPLNVVAGHAKMIASDEAPEENRDSARVIAEQAARMTAIIRQLLDFARRNKPQLSVGDLAAVTEHTIQMLSRLAQQRKAELRLSAARPAARVRMDEAQMQQAITNLIVNAVQAMPGGGVVEVDLAEVRRDERQYLRLAIHDQGPGIAPEHLPHIFEPFFTTKGVGEGTGLGLPVCYGIVQEHGGFIEVESAVGAGTRFCVFLPVVSAEDST
jgi:signal transduction histidine kinase